MSQLNINWEGWSSESIDIHFDAPMTRIAMESSAKVPAALIGIDLAKGQDETVIVQLPAKPQ